MRPPARAAGSALLVAALLGACAADGPPARDDGGLLLPLGVHSGGFLAPGAFRAFVAPVAVAASGPDVWVADAGLDAVFHLDPAAARLTRLPGLRARAGMRLKAPGDATLFVLDPGHELVRVSRDGAVLQRLADPVLLAGAADFALEPATGRLLVLDRGQGRIAVLSGALAAQTTFLLPRGAGLQAPWAIAAAPSEAAYVIDRGRRRIALVDRDGQLLAAFDPGTALPGFAQVDRRGRLFVHDAARGALHVFENARAVAVLGPAELGAGAIADFSLGAHELVVASATPPSVRLFRLR